MDAPMPPELLNYVDILSPNENELCCLAQMPTENFEDITRAAAKCHRLVSCSSSTLGITIKCSSHYAT